MRVDGNYFIYGVGVVGGMLGIGIVWDIIDRQNLLLDDRWGRFGAKHAAKVLADNYGKDFDFVLDALRSPEDEVPQRFISFWNQLAPNCWITFQWDEESQRMQVDSYVELDGEKSIWTLLVDQNQLPSTTVRRVFREHLVQKSWFALFEKI
jgi:hypothetical protein